MKGEVIVQGSSALGCETKMVREWLRVSCHGEGGGRGIPMGVAITKDGDGGIARTFFEEGRMGLVMRYERGASLEALFSWTNQSHKFRASWPASERTAPPVKAVFEGVRSPLDVPAVAEGKSCRKNPHCGPGLECCFDPTQDAATCAKQCAEISLVACVTKADCDPGLHCTDVGYDVKICAP